MIDPNNVKKVTALSILIALGLFLVYALLPFINAIFGAIILYIIFTPVYVLFHEKFKFGKGISAFIVILLILLIIIIPLIFLLFFLLGEIGLIIEGGDAIVAQVVVLDKIFPGLDIPGLVTSQIGTFGQFLKSVFLSTLGEVSGAVIGGIVMFVIMFYLFVNTKHISRTVHLFSPFKKKNMKVLVDELQRVTRSTVITTVIIAVIQGVLLGFGFWALGLPQPLLWGFIGGIVSFIPVIGIPIIWVPASILSFMAGDPVAGTGILIWGIILSSGDNVIRPMLQKKYGEIHPLVSIIGFFIGIPFFGILGAIIGPLLINYFFLLWKMFSEEYVTH